MRVGVYGTARNESANLAAWLDSCAGADVIVLNDTGSSDDTYALAAADPRVRAFREPVPAEPTGCFLFNLAMACLPDDVDLAVRLDLDERLQPGWREAIEAAWTPTERLVLRVKYDHMGLEYAHDRVHSRHGFHWHYPVHEVLAADGPITYIQTEARIEHHQDPTKDRSAVLGVLERAHADDPTDLRMLHYLGREYTYYGRWQDAIPHLRAHALSDAFPEERSESWRLLGECYAALMPADERSLKPYMKAVAVSPERREGWVALADLAMQQGDWSHCIYAAGRALAITEKGWYFAHPWAWNGKPEHLAALASWYLNRYDDALRYGTQAVDLDPNNELYRANLEWYRQPARV